MDEHSLLEEIERMVALGETDPFEAAKKLAARHGQDWLAQQLVSNAEDILAEMFRRRLGAVRRKAEIALRPGDEMASAEMKVAKTWVPGDGWKKVADLTASDLVAKAQWYRRLSSAATRRAVWCEDVVALMKREGVKRLGALKATLPPLPPEEGLALDG